MNNEDSLNVVFKISNSIDYEVKDKIVTILEKQNHPIQNFFRKLKFRIPLYKKIKNLFKAKENPNEKFC